jgi:hypothetical protein
MKFLFRIDDIGAATKEFEQHGRKWFNIFGKKILYFPLANFWFFKRINPFKRWAKYNELTASEWREFIEIFKKNNIIPVVAITACWVDKQGKLIEFPNKFKEEANFLKKAFHRGEIIIANHGLTHCVVGKHLPLFWGSNRSSWREFLPDLPQELHTSHIKKSQNILENFFEKPIKIFVPPGNVWSYKTYIAIKNTNIDTIMSNRYMMDSNQITEGVNFIADSDKTFVFHDRELKIFGKGWLIKKIKLLNDCQ